MSRPRQPLAHLTGTGRPAPPPIKYKPTARPYAPKDMDEDAKTMWRHLTTLLGDSGVLDEADRYALELVSRSYGMWKRAVKEFEAKPVAEGSRGNLVRSPWGDIANTEAERLRKLLNEFGLTPAARVKLGAIQQDSPLDKELEQLLSH
jgi:P27 family predicted phage terminase small subunit